MQATAEERIHKSNGREAKRQLQTSLIVNINCCLDGISLVSRFWILDSQTQITSLDNVVPTTTTQLAKEQPKSTYSWRRMQLCEWSCPDRVRAEYGAGVNNLKHINQPVAHHCLSVTLNIMANSFMATSIAWAANTARHPLLSLRYL